jgi:hypothetical protein
MTERWKTGVIVALTMALINIGTILYAAGRNDGGTESRLSSIERQVARIERILERQFGPGQ